MSILRNILYIYIIFGLIVSCKKKHEIEICSYEHTDSLVFKERNSESYINLISSIRLSQLETHSEDLSEQRIVKNINNFIINELSNTHKEKINPDSIVNQLYSDNMSELLMNLREKELIDEDAKATSPHPNKELEISDTLYNRIYADCHFGLGDTILCVRISSSVYTGGAHPGKTTYCYSFSLNDGGKIKGNRIVPRDQTTVLLSRIKHRLMEMKHFQSEEELESNGFREIIISPYLLLDKDSLTFFYESYSIAPFCEGDIEVKFSYKELEDISLLNK